MDTLTTTERSSPDSTGSVEATNLRLDSAAQALDVVLRTLPVIMASSTQTHEEIHLIFTLLEQCGILGTYPTLFRPRCCVWYVEKVDSVALGPRN